MALWNINTGVSDTDVVHDLVLCINDRHTHTHTHTSLQCGQGTNIQHRVLPSHPRESTWKCRYNTIVLTFVLSGLPSSFFNLLQLFLFRLFNLLCLFLCIVLGSWTQEMNTYRVHLRGLGMLLSTSLGIGPPVLNFVPAWAKPQNKQWHVYTQREDSYNPTKTHIQTATYTILTKFIHVDRILFPNPILKS